MTVKISNVIKQETGGHTYYIGYMDAKDVYDCVFVPVLRKTKLPKKKNATLALEEIDKGYQRTATVSRQRKIANFLLENPGSIIPPVLLSDRGQWKFNGKGDIGELVINSKAAVVDGQHRLGGMRFLAEMDTNSHNLKIPFVCVADLKQKEEEVQFLTINNEQKGLQKQHTAVLRSDLWHNACAISLNNEGPFKERIQTGGPKEKWELDWKLNSVASMIDNVFKTSSSQDDPWGFSSDQERKDHIPDLLIKYWEIVVDVFDEEYSSDIEKIPSPFGEDYGGDGNTRLFEYKLLEYTGFLVFMRVLKIYAPTFWNRSEFILNENLVYKYLTIIKTETEQNPNNRSSDGFDNVPIIDLRKSGKYQYNTGLAGAPVIVNDIQNLIASKRLI